MAVAPCTGRLLVTVHAVSAFLCRVPSKLRPTRFRFDSEPLASETTARSIPVATLTQLYVEETQRNEGASTIRPFAARVPLTAILVTGAHERLVSDLEECEHARFFEQAIEEYLGISDRVVKVESRKFTDFAAASNFTSKESIPMDRFRLSIFCLSR